MRATLFTLVIFVVLPTFASSSSDFSDQLIKQALQDARFEVSQNEHGDTTIKKRTEKSQNPEDEKELEKAVNTEHIFNIGVGLGYNYANRKALEFPEDDNIFGSTRSNFEGNIEFGVRPPIRFFKRFLVGGTVALPGPGDGKVHSDESPNSTGRYLWPLRTLAFGEFDYLVLPGKEKQSIFSAGFYQGSYTVRSTINPGPSNDLVSYVDTDTRMRERGIQLRYRAVTWNNGLRKESRINGSFYILVRVSNQGMYSAYVGSMLNFGKRVSVRRPVEK